MLLVHVASAAVMHWAAQLSRMEGARALTYVVCLLSAPFHVAIVGCLIAWRSQSNQASYMVSEFQEEECGSASSLKPGDGNSSTSLPPYYIGQVSHEACSFKTRGNGLSLLI